MALPSFDFEVMVENEEANKPERVKFLTRHDEKISMFHRWIDWEGTVGLFLPANEKKTLFHFMDHRGPVPLRLNVPRYTILCGERYKRYKTFD